MEIPVLVESLGDDTFRALTASPVPLAAEGRSSAEAVENLRSKIASELGKSRKIVSLEVPAQHPWTPYIGQFENDPLYDDWQAAIAEYRRQRAMEDDA
jgi:hypothetical protein